jgi:hypothetical protein
MLGSCEQGRFTEGLGEEGKKLVINAVAFNTIYLNTMAFSHVKWEIR